MLTASLTLCSRTPALNEQLSVSGLITSLRCVPAERPASPLTAAASLTCSLSHCIIQLKTKPTCYEVLAAHRVGTFFAGQTSFSHYFFPLGKKLETLSLNEQAQNGKQAAVQWGTYNGRCRRTGARCCGAAPVGAKRSLGCRDEKSTDVD